MAFSRIAIVNRGEAAMRLIHAVRELNAAGDGPIQTVALHTTGEANAMFVREADLSYDLGPASARPYVDLAVLEQALLDTGADAVWPGWGFVAEDPTFVDLCDKHRRDLHRAERRGDAPARRQDRLEADRRGGRRTGGARGAAAPSTPSRTRSRSRRRGRLPADAQGHRRWRRPRDPDGRLRRRPRGRLPAHQRRGAARPSATAPSSSSAWSPAPATSRCS